MAVTVGETGRLEELRAEWDNLLRESPLGCNLFSTWDWQRIWWQFFGNGAKLRLLAIRDAGTLVGIWPLMEQDNVTTLVGGVEVCDYLDVVALAGREREVLEAGLAHLSREKELAIDLRFVPAASATVRELPELAARRDWSAECSVDEVCPRVALPGDWDSYLASLSKKDRHELRRKLRHLGEAGELRFEVTTGAEGLERDVADFLHLHRLSRPEKAVFMDAAMEGFFRAIIARFRPSGRIKIYFLSLDGQRVAATLCIEHGDELWVYNSGFDRSYAQLSVGLALKAFCIEDAITQGKRMVDFLRGREPYKYDLGAVDYPVCRIRLTRA